MISHRGQRLFWLSRQQVRRKGLCKEFISTHQCMQLSSLIIMWRLYLCSVFHYGRTFIFLFLLLANINELRNNEEFILYIMLDLFIFCIPFVLYIFCFVLFFSLFLFHSLCFRFLATLYRMTVRFSSSVKSTFSPLFFVNVQELFLTININNDKQILN